MNKIVQHPRRDEGLARNLPRGIAARRAEAITVIKQAIDTLTCISREPGYEFAGEFVSKFMCVLVELEKLDSAGPPPSEELFALGKQLEGFRAEFILGIIDAGRSSP